MPLYSFVNDETGEIKEVHMSMDERHEYVDAHGKKWRRLFNIPNAAIDTRVEAWSEKDFVNKTGNKRGYLGDMFDRSKEMSEKRRKTFGVDPVQEKHFDNYRKLRRRDHPVVRKRKLKESLASKDIILEE